MSQDVSPLKPFLKWAGGKRQLLPVIRQHLPEFQTYFEPFVGAGAVLFDIRPERAVAGDFNRQLMTTYTAIRDRIEETCTLLKQHKDNHSKEYYYEIRAMDRDPVTFAALDGHIIAARFIFLNKTCYNGLYRVNSKGFFNVPAGRYKNPLICEEQTLRAVHRYFNDSSVTLVNADFEETVKDARKGDFVYFDPPYHSPDNSNFTGYQAGGFSELEQQRLSECFHNLSARGVRCLLSNSDTDFIKKLYRNHTIITLPAKRLINNKAEGRGPVNELLIKNW